MNTKGFQKNWLVRVYDATGQCFSSWRIDNRYEWEATREAESDVQRLGEKADDWSMTPVLKNR